MHCNGKSSGNCPFGFSGRVRNTRSGEAILASSNGGCGASDAKAFPKESDEIATPNVYSLVGLPLRVRSEEHTSELQSLMRISYAVFCLKKKKQNNYQQHTN